MPAGTGLSHANKRFSGQKVSIASLFPMPVPTPMYFHSDVVWVCEHDPLSQGHRSTRELSAPNQRFSCISSQFLAKLNVQRVVHAQERVRGRFHFRPITMFPRHGIHGLEECASLSQHSKRSHTPPGTLATITVTYHYPLTLAHPTAILRLSSPYRDHTTNQPTQRRLAQPFPRALRYASRTVPSYLGR